MQTFAGTISQLDGEQSKNTATYGRELQAAQGSKPLPSSNNISTAPWIL